MRLNRIAGMILASALCFALTGAARAETRKDVQPDLKQVNERAQKIARQAKDAMKSVSIAKPQATVKRASQSTPKLASMSDLLKGASDEAKKEFLESILIVDGQFASVNLHRLKQELGEARADEINRILNPHPMKMFKRTPLQTLALCNGNVCYDAVCQSGSDGHLGCYDSRRNTCYGPCNAFASE